MNKIIVTGRICNELELKENGETKILNLNIAVRRKFKDKDGNYPTDFISCVAFNNTAVFVHNFFRKRKSNINRRFFTNQKL